MFAGKKSAQIREILISESAWEEMTCLFAPSLGEMDEAIYYVNNNLKSWIRTPGAIEWIVNGI
ncbi:hypothetical protein KRB69_004801 [Salmonella enterica]|nr:hypothetical protein [Salmonella enterica]